MGHTSGFDITFLDVGHFGGSTARRPDMGAPIVGNSDIPVKLIIPNENSWGDAIPARTRGWVLFASPANIVSSASDIL